MGRFCANCGKNIEKGILCETCRKEPPSYKPINIKLCPSMKYFFKGKWSKFSDLRVLTEKLLKTSIPGKFKLLEGLDSAQDLLLKPGLKKSINAAIEYQGEEYVVPISVEITYSPGVGKQGTSYFEGILQIRNFSPEIKKYFHSYAEKNELKINKIVEKNDSADYYFVSKSKIVPAAHKLVRNFGGYIDTSPQLFSKNKLTSRDIYRVTTTVYTPDFVVGDVVELEGTFFLVRNTSKLIAAVNLSNGVKSSFHYNSKTAPIIKKIQKMKTTVSIVHPRLEVIHPVSFQSVAATNPLDVAVSSGGKVFVVLKDDSAIIIG